ncbi:MAG TPA: hypothetical protein VE988_15125, partial [Gemmataceae bacterium]|nr:hypothetical protein [Gemmataceae bacterium]
MILSPLQLRMELAYRRRVLFAVELVDAVTLERVSQGISVAAVGLRGAPVVNTSGLFVWFEEDFERLRRISIDPGSRPYEHVELTAQQVQRPLTTVELPPRIDYPFATGVTGLRGTVIESQVLPPRTPEPVRDAEVRLRWLSEEAEWHDAPTATHTDARSGDFVSILRFGPTEKPAINANGEVTVQLRVRRGEVS